MKKLLVSLLLLVPMSVYAQDIAYGGESDVPKVEISGGYQFIHYIAPDIATLEDIGLDMPDFNGWYASILGNFTENFGIEGEVSGAYADLLEMDLSFHNFVVGPRYTFRQEPVNPYLHALVGFARQSVNDRDYSDSDSVFSMVIGSGLDWNINENFGIRAPQIDYLFDRDDGKNEHYIRIGAGVVFRIH